MKRKMGESHHRAKLTDAQVRQIRIHQSEGLSYGKLSKIYGCGESTIRDICTYRTRYSA